jgi:N6-adenosine-specific RNA methylase IME4
LFARQKTDGWDVWGNEVLSDKQCVQVNKEQNKLFMLTF